MKVFVTSDLLFGRQKAAEDRGFGTADEMEKVLIDRWNSSVGVNDLVYHLGNFSWDPISAETALPYLNGKIVFGSGMYDRHMADISQVLLGKHSILKHSINVLRDIPISKKKKFDVVMSYWPLIDWPGKENGIMHIHGGSIASNLEDGHRFSASCDRWDLKPVEIELLFDVAKDHSAGKDKVLDKH
jgi:calcineurin-like phosphoesterase family protein